MLSKYNSLKEFDTITRFRLINAFLFGMGFYLILPVLMDLRGELLTATFITFILIVTTLSIKTNEYLVTNFSMSDLYKLGIFVHFIFTAGAFLYFYDKLMFVYVDSFVGIIEVAVFSSYRIKLDSYLATYYSETVSKFQVFRNSTFADATLIGLFITWFATYYGSNGYAITIFLGTNIMFMLWMTYNWNFIDKNIRKD